VVLKLLIFKAKRYSQEQEAKLNKASCKLNYQKVDVFESNSFHNSKYAPLTVQCLLGAAIVVITRGSTVEFEN